MSRRYPTLYLSCDLASAQILITWLWRDVRERRDSKFKYTALSFIDSETSRLHVAEEFRAGRGGTCTCGDYLHTEWHGRASGRQFQISKDNRNRTTTKTDLTPSPTSSPSSQALFLIWFFQLAALQQRSLTNVFVPPVLNFKAARPLLMCLTYSI